MKAYIRVATLREKSLENENFSGSWKSQGSLVRVREIAKIGKSQGKVREFQNFLKTDMAVIMEFCFEMAFCML